MFSDHVEEHGKEFFNLVTLQGLEGMLAKDASSPYQTGRRSASWLKIKSEQRQEAVIGGFTDPGGGRKHFGSLLLGVYQGKELVYVGHVGTGFNEARLREIRSEAGTACSGRVSFQEETACQCSGALGEAGAGL